MKNKKTLHKGKSVGTKARKVLKKTLTPVRDASHSFMRDTAKMGRHLSKATKALVEDVIEGSKNMVSELSPALPALAHVRHVRKSSKTSKR